MAVYPDFVAHVVHVGDFEATRSDTFWLETAMVSLKKKLFGRKLFPKLVFNPDS